MMRHIKRHILLTLVLCGLAAFAPEHILAHRVNVFGMVSGNSIQVECAFSKSNRVREGKLFFLDRETQTVVHEATTDEQGLYTLKASDIAPILEAGHGLLIRLVAGEGHQNEWEMDAAELAPLAGKGAAKTPGVPEAASQAPGVPDAAPQAPATTRAATPETPAEARPVTNLSEAELEALVSRVVDARLAPIHKALAREDEPNLRDIVGGIGWILGLVGLATYLRYRPR